jgi:hypothetical protein
MVDLKGSHYPKDVILCAVFMRSSFNSIHPTGSIPLVSGDFHL